jgi:uncharacterized protein with HEPN domain
MPPEALKLLVDIQSSLAENRDFTAGMDDAAYRIDAKCRAAVERKFEIIGEACTRLRDRFPDFYSKIESGPQIVGFRNRLIHGYDNMNNETLSSKWLRRPAAQRKGSAAPPGQHANAGRKLN